MLPGIRNAPGAELVSFHPTGTAIPVLWMYTHFRIVHPGGGAQPSVIVQVFGNGHFWRKRPRRLPANADIHRVQLAYPAVSHQFSRLPKLLGAAVLGADLGDGSFLFYRVP